LGKGRYCGLLALGCSHSSKISRKRLAVLLMWHKVPLLSKQKKHCPLFQIACSGPQPLKQNQPEKIGCFAHVA
jgi:hypothetical protein